MAVQNARPTPFNTLTSDADWESITGGLGASDGVISAISGSLAPSLDTGGRNAVMAAGSCLVKGKIWSCDASVSTAIPAASGQDRIDRLTMRLLRTAGNATAFLQPNIIQGTPSGTPVIPNLTQTTTGIWDLPICHWTSRSTGGLVTLVDERFDCGTDMQSGLAGNMPLWHVRPRLYYQTDTGVLMVWNGSSWVPVAPQPATWLNMPAMANSWANPQYAKYRLTINGDLQVRFKGLTTGTVVDGTNVWNAGALPSAYQVPDNHRVVCYSDALKSSGTFEASAFEFAPDGSIQCYGFATSATRADLYAVIPLT
jgi:hypothetical protein